MSCLVDFTVVPVAGAHGQQRRHYIDHLSPVWHALPPEVRGEFQVLPLLADYARSCGIEPKVYSDSDKLLKVLARRKKRVSVVCGHRDPIFTDRASRRNIIMMHGVGFTFDQGRQRHPSYPGTNKNRANTILMLATNDEIASLEKGANPTIPVVVVGCPKLDAWHPAPPYQKPSAPVVALAWHWRCSVASAAGTAFDYFLPALRELRSTYKVLGHGHPHIIEEITPIYERIGIEVVPSLSEVFRRAHLMVADATSAMYEFAAIGKPVVVATGPGYGDPRQPGGMLAYRSKLGIEVTDPDYLIDTVTRALKDPVKVKKSREAVVKRAYTYTDGKCAQRAVEAILNVVRGL